VEQLAARTAVVIGAGSGGIGTGVADACAEAGMRVVAADIDHEGARRVADRINAAGGSAIGAHVDATDRASLTTLRDTAIEAFGSVDLLSNNVGVIVTGPLADATEQQWQWVLELNVMTIVRSVQVFLPALRAAGGDTHITFTSSMAGLMRPSLPGMAIGVYTASKHALIGYGDALRAELAPEGIGVTVLCPGPVSTHLTETSARHRPERFGGRFETSGPAPPGQDPRTAGRALLRAVCANRFLALTHPELGRFVEKRCRSFADDFAFAAEQEVG
jgi:NAD(P)-dependent dehydrogenase (short-subunit alcohol dehydrogenase family)